MPVDIHKVYQEVVKVNSIQIDNQNRLVVVENSIAEIADLLGKLNTRIAAVEQRVTALEKQRFGKSPWAGDKEQNNAT